MTIVWLLPFVFAWLASAATDQSVSERGPSATRSSQSAGVECLWINEDESKIPGNDFIAGATIETLSQADHFMRCRRRIPIPQVDKRAILERLTEQSANLVSKIHSDPEASIHPWKIRVYHPDERLRAKLRFAFALSLKSRQFVVSEEQEPVAFHEPKSFADLPKFCSEGKAFFASGDPVLVVFLPDQRVTGIFAGACNRQRWQWLI